MTPTDPEKKTLVIEVDTRQAEEKLRELTSLAAGAARFVRLRMFLQAVAIVSGAIAAVLLCGIVLLSLCIALAQLWGRS